jgi:hypothetical protein
MAAAVIINNSLKTSRVTAIGSTAATAIGPAT